VLRDQPLELLRVGEGVDGPAFWVLADLPGEGGDGLLETPLDVLILVPVAEGPWVG
jgi:hypothetical protein